MGQGAPLADSSVARVRALCLRWVALDAVGDRLNDAGNELRFHADT
jgi:hypothetical protein